VERGVSRSTVRRRGLRQDVARLKTYYSCRSVGIAIDRALQIDQSTWNRLRRYLQVWQTRNPYSIDVDEIGSLNFDHFFASNDFLVLVLGDHRSSSRVVDSFCADTAAVLAQPLADSTEVKGQPAKLRWRWSRRKVAVIATAGARGSWVVDRLVDLGAYEVGREPLRDPRMLVEAIHRIFRAFLRIPKSSLTQVSLESPRRLSGAQISRYQSTSKDARRRNAGLYGKRSQKIRRIKNASFALPPHPDRRVRPMSSESIRELVKARPYRYAILDSTVGRGLSLCHDPWTGMRLPYCATEGSRPLPLVHDQPPSLKSLQRDYRRFGFCFLGGWFDFPFITKDCFGYYEKLFVANAPSSDLLLRDDHLLRYLNSELTSFAVRLSQCPLTMVGAGNANWYQSGIGFAPHIDGSPFFDVSLIISLGPAPVVHRVALVEKTRPGSPRVFEMLPGDGLFFAGSELLHLGEPFDARERHCVIVLPWTYVRR
jgi:hypothetical protein